MPKKRTKVKKGRTETEEDDLDSASVLSVTSEDSEIAIHNLDVEDISDLQSSLDNICATLDGLTEKRPDTRIKALNYLLKAFRLQYLSLDDTWNYYDTFLSGIDYVLRKGRSHDQALAVECLAVFSLQIDSHSIVTHFARFLPTLDIVLRDENGSCQLRSACATAMSTLLFIAGNYDFLSAKDLMKSLEDIFKGSCLKGDGKAPVLNPLVSDLHVSALRAWGLLYTILIPHDADVIGKALLPTLIKLLQTSDVDMRIMAGEIAALIYERIRTERDERYKGPYYNSLVSLLNELATDGAKSRSKVDRKKQRHFFRDFADTVTRTDIAETSINIGPEVLVLSSCVEHFHYELLCYLLKGGVSRHLRQNYLVRDWFDLGSPVVINKSHQDRRLEKGQRRLEQTFASKLRTQKMNTFRDCRNNIVPELD